MRRILKIRFKHFAINKKPNCVFIQQFGFFNKKRKSNLSVQLTLSLVRRTGLEPVWLPTRPSNVRVCQFRHPRKPNYYSKTQRLLSIDLKHKLRKFCFFKINAEFLLKIGCILRGFRFDGLNEGLSDTQL